MTFLSREKSKHPADMHRSTKPTLHVTQCSRPTSTTSTLNAVRTWLWILFATLIPVTNVVASEALPLTKGQQQCLLAQETLNQKISNIAANDALSCQRKHVQGTLKGMSLDDCLHQESQTLQRAKAQLPNILSKQCNEFPFFGPNGTRTPPATTALNRLFGKEAETVLKTGNNKTQNCQLMVTTLFNRLKSAEIESYQQCVRQRIQQSKVSGNEDLEACVGIDSPTVVKARIQTSKSLAQACPGIAVENITSGHCKTASDATSLAACLASEARCESSAQLNVTDRLQTAGHTFKDGVATHYCGERPANTQSVARQWNEDILSAIRIDTPRPPVHARNLFHLSAAMYDAWATFDTKAKPYALKERHNTTNLERDRETAISFAAYRILKSRYSSALALGHAKSEARFTAHMHELGFDSRYDTNIGDTPAAIGNRIAATILQNALNDGALESTNYKDTTYTSVNQPLIVKLPDIAISDIKVPGYTLNPNRWQPLFLDLTISQNGIPLPDTLQSFIGSQWGSVVPFAMQKNAPSALYLDPGPPPQLGGSEDQRFKNEVLRVIELASQLTPDDPTMMDSSPASWGNHSLGTNDGQGYRQNPVTGLAYAPQMIKRGDFGRVLAEFWADGPTSETPPGHWNLIANSVADNPEFKHRFAGQGATLNRLEWDIKTYFALNGATHDAAIACWGAKRKYDGVRPITMVRYMAKMGQSSDSKQPSYHPHGLPLKEGLVELITEQSSAKDQRHANLVTPSIGGKIGDIAILSWPGSPNDPKKQYSGVRWELGKSWVPYQRPTFVTPAFPGYYSGHSTFSRSAAEVLTNITGSPFFPGGLMDIVIKKNGSLIHEYGPSEDVHLQWARYYDAADQAGVSRLWGGIHVDSDDFIGRITGQKIGTTAFTLAKQYFDGTAP